MANISVFLLVSNLFFCNSTRISIIYFVLILSYYKEKLNPMPSIVHYSNQHQNNYDSIVNCYHSTHTITLITFNSHHRSKRHYMYSHEKK